MDRTTAQDEEAGAATATGDEAPESAQVREQIHRALQSTLDRRDNGGLPDVE